MYFSFLRLLLTDPCGALFLAAIVLAVGHCAIGQDHVLRRIGAALGGVAFLVTVWIGTAQGGDAGTLAVGSLGWACVMVGASWIVLAIIAPPCRYVITSIRAAQRERERRAEHERWAAAERERQEDDRRRKEELRLQMEAERRKAAESMKPEPTRQERIAEAKREYENTLRTLEEAGLDAIELNAARERAKQKYLRELDRWM